MTYYQTGFNSYQWTAFTEADLLANGRNGTSFGLGDSFVMSGKATVTMSTVDNDCALNGDNSFWYGDNASEDRSGQDASVNGAAVGCKMYAESYHVLHGSDGKTYYLIEINVEGYSAPGQGDSFYSFYGAKPMAGVQLTVVQTCNVSGNWVDYRCLGAGDLAPPNTPPQFTNVPENGVLCVAENTKLVIDLNATDADGDVLATRSSAAPMRAPLPSTRTPACWGSLRPPITNGPARRTARTATRSSWRSPTAGAASSTNA